MSKRFAATVQMSISWGQGVAIVSRSDSSTKTVAGVLGRERAGGKEIVYLDRIVHGIDQDWQGWRASGAVSTILERSAPAEPDGCIS